MATAAPSPLASSREKTNGNKLSRLLIDGGTTVLKNIFDRHHKPANLASGLNANYSILNKLLRRRVLNKTGGDSSNKGCFGRKTNLFRESGDFAGNRESGIGNRETWEFFREI